jgi:hypothetical protein
MPLSIFGRCDKLTTTAEADTSSLRSTCSWSWWPSIGVGVLTGEHLGTPGEVFASVCADVGAELVELDGEDDPVHLLVADPPHSAVARLVNSRKGVSARRLRQRYRVRTHREHLWPRS